MSHDRAAIHTDAVIVGAGPVGLFQVFQLGLLEVQAHVVDSLPRAGGQCVELYGDKPIYDIPALAVCTGRELTDRLLDQIRPFGATLHLGHEVTRVERRSDGGFDVQTSSGTRFAAKAVIVAGGVGAFRPRKLKIDGLAQVEGTQVFHRLDEPSRFAHQHVVVAGDGDAALEAALQLAEPGPDRAASVTLVHRRDSFRAAPQNVDRFRERCSANAMQFVAGQIVGVDAAGGALRALHVAGSDGVPHRLAVDALLVLLGLSPQLGPIAAWGLDIDRKQVVVDTEKFETGVPGIFAVGDINTYPGKKKLILCGFHEATLAAYGVARVVDPERVVQLQYTTTSPRLHQLLGVKSPAPD